MITSKTKRAAIKRRDERNARAAQIQKAAALIWKTSSGGRRPLTDKQKDTMQLAYIMGVLPQTDAYIGQWVEDNMPVIF